MDEPAFLFLGEALWLDLANTAPTPLLLFHRPDPLSDPEASTTWLRCAGLPPLDPRLGGAALLMLRTELIRLGDALAGGGRPPTSAVTTINTLLRGHGGCEQLTRIGGSWRLRFVPTEPPGALEALAWSAAQSLADPRALVRRCIEPSCRRLFLDTSPDHTRTWCRDQCRAVAGLERRRGSRTVPTV
jgi:predicted RNA-binding Zn ribbon-like protein